jgi:anti-sigma B factor antagonist
VVSSPGAAADDRLLRCPAVDTAMTVEVTEYDGSAVLAVRGEVDVATAPRLREYVVDAVTNGYRYIVIDLDGVDFLDSTGLGVLVGALKRVRTHEGELHFVCTQPRILKVFDITGLDRVLSIHTTVDEALPQPKG